MAFAKLKANEILQELIQGLSIPSGAVHFIKMIRIVQLFQQGFPQKLWKTRLFPTSNLWKTLWKLCKTLSHKPCFYINSRFTCGKVDFSWFEKLFVGIVFFYVFNKKIFFRKKLLTSFLQVFRLFSLFASIKSPFSPSSYRFLYRALE